MLSQVDYSIINEIKNKIDKDQLYFSYNDVTKKEGIHNFARYPATMVPEMQKDILEILCANVDAKSLLDPFMGSGTVLVEGIKNGLDVYGMDINPYAYYLTKSKLNYLPVAELEECRNKLINSIINDDTDYDIHGFDKIDKWFRKDYQNILSKIRDRISKIENLKLRLFFMISFSDVVTTLKNSQSSTFKLHIKKNDKIESFNKDAIKEFVNKVDKNIISYKEYINILISKKLIKRIYKTEENRFRNKVTISCDDSRKLKKNLKLRKNSIDLIVTSPPYGDNQTTVTYGQFSTLPLFWMHDDDFKSEFNEELFQNFSAIDRASLGGKIYSKEIIEKSKLLVKSLSLKKFYDLMVKFKREDKGRKVVTFIIDFYEVLLQMHNVLKVDGYMVFVVGNRRVHNNIVPFDVIINELLMDNFEKITKFDRLIKNKKMASKISNVNNESVKSMDTEIILVFKKK